MSTESKKKVLLFSYYWPPASSPGVQRWLKFVKYLEDYGWASAVITPKNGSYPNTDATLLNDIPDDTELLTTKTLEPFRLFNLLTGQAKRGKASSVGMGDLKGAQSPIKKISAYIRANWFIPDARKGWNRYAIRTGIEYIQKQNVDAIITTGPPHSSHLIGLNLSRKFNLPWVADFRDPWTNIYYNHFLPRSSSTQKKDLALETKVLSNASLVTVVSNGLLQEFSDRARSTLLLPNGYDLEDFYGKHTFEKSDKFTLSYIGNLKENQNIEALWTALSELINANPQFAQNFRLSLTGNIHPTVLQSITQAGLNPNLIQYPFVQHHQAIEQMISASALLFPIPQSAQNKKIITGKIFEYLASRTPLVSIGPPDGDAAKILHNCERSPMIDPDNMDEIKHRIKHLYEEWLHNDRKVLVPSILHQQFSRKGLAHTLSIQLNRLIHHA